MYKSQALEFRTPLFPHLVPPAIMVRIFVWKYIFEPFIHILQHFCENHNTLSKVTQSKHLSLDCYMKISATCKNIRVYFKFSRISG
jgi:hypothetical protein